MLSVLAAQPDAELLTSAPLHSALHLLTTLYVTHPELHILSLLLSQLSLTEHFGCVQHPVAGFMVSSVSPESWCGWWWALVPPAGRSTNPPVCAVQPCFLCLGADSSLASLPDTNSHLQLGSNVQNKKPSRQLSRPHTLVARRCHSLSRHWRAAQRLKRAICVQLCRKSIFTWKLCNEQLHTFLIVGFVVWKHLYINTLYMYYIHFMLENNVHPAKPQTSITTLKLLTKF